MGEAHKIRILHMLPGLYMGGAEILVSHYIQALGTESYEHFVYYFDSDGPARNRFEAMGVPVYGGLKKPTITQPIRFVVDLYSLIKNLLSFIKSNRIQIIQSHLTYANQLSVMVGKISGVPAVPTIHNTMAFEDDRSKLDLRVYLKKTINAVTYRVADRVVAISSEIKEIIQQNFGLRDSKILVVKNGIVFVDMTLSNVDLKEEILGIGTKLKLIAVGRLAHQKYIESLVEAVGIVVKQGFRDLFVMVVGEGENRLQIEKMIRENKLERYIKLLGIRHDVVELMKNSDVFVMPSRYEGLSIAMIEAMACGLPIIASDGPGLNRYINQGVNGVIFKVGDHKGLAEQILRLAKDKQLRSKLSCGSKSTFKKEYDLRSNIKPLDELFRKASSK